MNQRQIDVAQQEWLEDQAVGRCLHVGCGMKPISGAVNLDGNPERWEYSNVAALAEALPFADGAFDTVVSSHVVSSFRDPARNWREMARVMVQGGKMAHVVPDSRFTPQRTSHHHIWNYQPFHWWPGDPGLLGLIERVRDVFRVAELEKFAGFDWSFKFVCIKL